MTRLLWLPEVLRPLGYPVIETAGWETAGKDGFNPRGGVCHHDGFPSTVSGANAVALLHRGRPDVPGPLCQIWLDDDYDLTGTPGDPAIYIISSGRANHAGKGGWNGLSGNTSVWGIEARNTGGPHDPWSPQMMECYLRVCCALAHKLGHGSEMVCAHKEWAPRRKIDPTFDMSAFRRAMKDRLTNAQSPVVPTPDMASDQAGRLLLLFASYYDRNGGTNGWPDLAEGSTGDFVRLVQGTLHALTGNPVSIDGVYGPSTKTAVENAQRLAQRGNPQIVVDGKCGDQTYKVLRFFIYLADKQKRAAA